MLYVAGPLLRARLDDGLGSLHPSWDFFKTDPGVNNDRQVTSHLLGHPLELCADRPRIDAR